MEHVWNMSYLVKEEHLFPICLFWSGTGASREGDRVGSSTPWNLHGAYRLEEYMHDICLDICLDMLGYDMIDGHI